MSSPRIPTAWTVAAASAVVGFAMGVVTVGLEAVGRPMRIGDFSAAATREPADERRHARVVVPESEHDFGVMSTAQSGSHRFRLDNEGGSPLLLRKGASSCGCTIAEFERAEIPPGESGGVTIEWRTKAEGGRFSQHVTVHTNDPRRPDVTLGITGEVVPTWRVVPPVISFPKLVAQGGDRATATLLAYGTPPPRIESLALTEPSTSAFFDVDHEPLDPEALALWQDEHATGGATISVTTRPGLPPGVVRQTIRLELGQEPPVTDDAAGPGIGGPIGPGEPPRNGIVVEIPIEGTVSGDIALAGNVWDSISQTIVLGSVSSRAGLRAELFLSVKGPHRDQVSPSVIEVVPTWLQVEIGESRPVGSGAVRRIPLGIAVPPGSPFCNHLGNQQGPAGRIVLETGHPDARRLEIPVRLAVGP